MKNLTRKTSILFFVLSLFIFSDAIAQKGQGKGKGKQEKELKQSKDQDESLKKNEEIGKEKKNKLKEEKKKVDKKMKDEKEKIDIKEPREVKEAKKENEKIEKKNSWKEKGKMNSGKGNAYGKNKEGLSGKEFGQQRAAEAKMKNEKVKEEHERSILTGERKANDATEIIRKKKEELEEARKNKEVNDEEYETKRAKVGLAEEALIRLQERLKKTKEDSEKK